MKSITAILFALLLSYGVLAQEEEAPGMQPAPEEPAEGVVVPGGLDSVLSDVATRVFAVFDAPKEQENLTVKSGTYANKVYRLYDYPVMILKLDGTLEKQTQAIAVFDKGGDLEAAFPVGGKRMNEVAPSFVEITSEEKLALGQDRLEAMISLGIAIPSSPTEDLPLKVRPKDWHGKVIVDYAALSRDVTAAGVRAAAISVTIKDPATDVQEEVFAIITVRKPRPLTEGGDPVAVYVVDRLKVN